MPNATISSKYPVRPLDKWVTTSTASTKLVAKNTCSMRWLLVTAFSSSKMAKNTIMMFCVM